MGARKMMFASMIALTLAVVRASTAWASSYDDLILNRELLYGNRSWSGVWELGINDVSPYALLDTDQYHWTSGAWEFFTLSGGPSILTYLEIGGVIYRHNTSMRVANMFLNGTAIPDNLFVSPSINSGD